MKQEFSFLKDERALFEIRKHKWIESQKAKREIGFATAALDWIKRFGEDWKKVHLKDKPVNHISERRRFRRYPKDFDFELNKGDACVKARAKELSFIGILCRSKVYIPVSHEVLISFSLQKEEKASYVKCKGIVNRIVPSSSREYEMFLRFDETGQRYVEDGVLIS